MYTYTILQWLFFFYFYCFFGWCFESLVVSFNKKKLVNRGFMRGPFLPLYGSGAIMMLLVSLPVKQYVVLVYIAGCIGATVLEYVTGVTMEALFKVRYWDYSSKKFNFQGHICLTSTLAWGFLTILMTEVVHKPIEQFVLSIPVAVLNTVTIILTVILAADFSASFKTALDMRDILVKLEKAKEELVHMQRRLDVIIAVTSNEWEERKAETEYRMEDLMLNIEEKLGGLKKRFQEEKSEYREELGELLRKYSTLKEKVSSRGKLRNFYQRHMILGNPGMYSTKFKEVVEEWKKAAQEYVKGNGNKE